MVMVQRTLNVSASLATVPQLFTFSVSKNNSLGLQEEVQKVNHFFLQKFGKSMRTLQPVGNASCS